MKQTLELKLGQKLALTPQLQQSIRLLQLSATELMAEINENLETNPLLERVESNSRDSHRASQVSTTEITQDQSSNIATDHTHKTGGELDNETNGSEFSVNDHGKEASPWEQHTAQGNVSTRSESFDDNEFQFDNQAAAQTNLRDHLRDQLRLVSLSRRDLVIGAAIIECIDDDGYLDATLGEIGDLLGEEIDADADEVEQVLAHVQNLEPAGVAARSLKECLHLQLKHLYPKGKSSAHAASLIDKHLELVGKRDFSKLKKATGLARKELDKAIDLIQMLNPRPGREVESEHTNYITPDVVVKKIDGEWVVSSYRSYHQNLRVNQEYKDMIRKGDRSKENQYLKNQLQQAQWFIRCVQNRESTVVRVARVIVEHQQDFLEQGESEMRPLVIRDIAEKLELHESTVSRATTQKYVLTPRGMFELRYFFSSHVRTTDGGMCSSRATQAKIKDLVTKENPRKPLSDSKISILLKDQGIQVARRTVAKYREQLRIPPSHQRKSEIN